MIRTSLCSITSSHENCASDAHASRSCGEAAAGVAMDPRMRWQARAHCQ